MGGEGVGGGKIDGAPVRTQGWWVDQRVVKPGAPVRKHKIGVCIVPPEACWAHIQAIRRENDRHYGTWMPHINLLFPISCTDEEVEKLPEILAQIVSRAKPFQVSLDSVGIFQHPLSCMLWARPSPQAAASMRWLQRALKRAFPDSQDDVSGDVRDGEWGVGSAVSSVPPVLGASSTTTTAAAAAAASANSASANVNPNIGINSQTCIGINSPT